MFEAANELSNTIRCGFQSSACGLIYALVDEPAVASPEPLLSNTVTKLLPQSPDTFTFN
jgi:hypothetical protein